MLIARPLSARERMRRWIRRAPMEAGLMITVSILMLLSAALSGTGLIRIIRSGRELDAAMQNAKDQAQKPRQKQRGRQPPEKTP
jgi:hypothetical protein